MKMGGKHHLFLPHSTKATLLMFHFEPSVTSREKNNFVVPSNKGGCSAEASMDGKRFSTTIQRNSNEKSVNFSFKKGTNHQN